MTAEVVPTAPGVAGPPPDGAVRRVEGRDWDEVRRVVADGQPVLLTHLARDWPPLRRWSFSYLRRWAQEEVVVAEVQDRRLVVSPREGIPQRRVPLGSFLEGLEGGATDAYLITPVGPRLEGLLDDLPLAPWLRGAPFFDVRLWIGPQDLCTPLHRDLPRNLYLQVAGSKRVVLIDPRHGRRLAPFGWLSRAPNFARADPDDDRARAGPLQGVPTLRCVVQAGEVLYIPPLWWHQLVSTAPSISVSLWWAEGMAALASRAAQRYASLRGTKR